MNSALLPNPPKPFLRVRNIYILFILLILVAAVFLGVMQGRKFTMMRVAAQESSAKFAVLQNDLDKIQKSFDEAKKSTETNQRSYEQFALQMLPQDEKMIELTKLLDDFFEKNFQVESEIVASNLRFGAGVSVPGKSYSMLPLSLTITASREKFEKFLQFVEQSGSFSPLKNVAGVRLLDLQAIRINLGQSEGKEQVSFTVDLRAFYRNPATNGNTTETPTT